MQIPLVNIILLALLVLAVLNEWHGNHIVMTTDLAVFGWLVWWNLKQAKEDGL